MDEKRALCASGVCVAVSERVLRMLDRERRGGPVVRLPDGSVWVPKDGPKPR